MRFYQLFDGHYLSIHNRTFSTRSVGRNGGPGSGKGDEPSIAMMRPTEPRESDNLDPSAAPKQDPTSGVPLQTSATLRLALCILASSGGLGCACARLCSGGEDNEKWHIAADTKMADTCRWLRVGKDFRIARKNPGVVFHLESMGESRRECIHMLRSSSSPVPNTWSDTEIDVRGVAAHRQAAATASTRVHGLGIGSTASGLQAGNVSGRLYGYYLAVRVCERIGSLMVTLQRDVTAAQATPMSPNWANQLRLGLANPRAEPAAAVQNVGGHLPSIPQVEWSFAPAGRVLEPVLKMR
ncbi:hypothetical protein MAPG_02560 [Magnaporthiopsis poae ATCC 64411]|uniref:Uncharacterized protein n=1 Tax=Magnaporthiopsis poae (strain ATCC 64411 / 73-15) TaxID=644358 RepID=A0A0C4DRP5_MAGP6|nr:hypothetical protein MAPG_02560 [Magnaporthiopsis poae ATCC 64411]